MHILRRKKKQFKLHMMERRFWIDCQGIPSSWATFIKCGKWQTDIMKILSSSSSGVRSLAQIATYVSYLHAVCFNGFTMRDIPYFNQKQHVLWEHVAEAFDLKAVCHCLNSSLISCWCFMCGFKVRTDPLIFLSCTTSQEGNGLPPRARHDKHELTRSLSNEWCRYYAQECTKEGYTAQ